MGGGRADGYLLHVLFYSCPNCQLFFDRGTAISDCGGEHNECGISVVPECGADTVYGGGCERCLDDAGVDIDIRICPKCSAHGRTTCANVHWSAVEVQASPTSEAYCCGAGIGAECFLDVS